MRVCERGAHRGGLPGGQVRVRGGRDRVLGVVGRRRHGPHVRRAELVLHAGRRQPGGVVCGVQGSGGHGVHYCRSGGGEGGGVRAGRAGRGGPRHGVRKWRDLERTLVLSGVRIDLIRARNLTGYLDGPGCGSGAVGVRLAAWPMPPPAAQPGVPGAATRLRPVRGGCMRCGGFWTQTK
jgi:hypothetical protein